MYVFLVFTLVDAGLAIFTGEVYNTVRSTTGEVEICSTVE